MVLASPEQGHGGVSIHVDEERVDDELATPEESLSTSRPWRRAEVMGRGGATLTWLVARRRKGGGRGNPREGALVKKEGRGSRGSHSGHVPLNITMRGEVIRRRKKR